MARHKGYETLKLLIEKKALNELKDIFKHIPESVIKRDLGINQVRFKRMIEKVEDFNLKELYTLARFTMVDERAFLDLAHNQYMANKNKKKGK